MLKWQRHAPTRPGHGKPGSDRGTRGAHFRSRPRFDETQSPSDELSRYTPRQRNVMIVGSHEMRDCVQGMVRAARDRLARAATSIPGRRHTMNTLLWVLQVLAAL